MSTTNANYTLGLHVLSVKLSWELFP
jgi:hypothetical protein